jgi:hypothetical protein
MNESKYRFDDISHFHISLPPMTGLVLFHVLGMKMRAALMELQNPTDLERCVNPTVSQQHIDLCPAN